MSRTAKKAQPRDGVELSNAELKKLLDKAVLKFENWKIQVNQNPNPRMVHNLKNILSIIDTISEVSSAKIKYSYKILSRQMALLSHEIAELNLAVVNALMEDDLVDEKETETINRCLAGVIRASIQLIKMVQNSFGIPRQLDIISKDN